jgi:hypothetical protein
LTFLNIILSIIPTWEDTNPRTLIEKIMKTVFMYPEILKPC